MTVEFGTEVLHVPVEGWSEAAQRAREDGFTYFDFLTAVDEQPAGFRVVLHVASVERPMRRLLLQTLVTDQVASIAQVYAGAAWHERETAEMFGVTFTATDGAAMTLDPLLLPDGFGAHPLRKDFVLAARVAKTWPGAKEPGDAAPARRRTRPPGVPEDWAHD